MAYLPCQFASSSSVRQNQWEIPPLVRSETNHMKSVRRTLRQKVHMTRFCYDLFGSRYLPSECRRILFYVICRNWSGFGRFLHHSGPLKALDGEGRHNSLALVICTEFAPERHLPRSAVWHGLLINVSPPHAMVSSA